MVGQKVLIKIPVRKPDRYEFFRTHPDPAFCIATALLPYEGEFHLVMPYMRYDVAEALPYELRFCINRGGAVFWWPIRLPGEDGKIKHLVGYRPRGRQLRQGALASLLFRSGGEHVHAGGGDGLRRRSRHGRSSPSPSSCGSALPIR